MRIAVILAVTSLWLVACRPDDQRTDSINPSAQATRGEMAPEAVAKLDSGNAAYRADDFQAALAHYTRVTELEPEQSSGWFGVYMAQKALGHEVAADSAFEKAQGLAPGASLIHPTAADTVR